VAKFLLIFFYTLPSADGECKSKTIPSNQLKHSTLAEKSHMKADHIVFLAEDDQDDQELLIEMMQDQGISLDFMVANTGSKALAMLNALPANALPSLIVLDYNLPEMSGAEILAKLQDLKKFDNTIKVVWSTSNSPVYEKKCMDFGAHTYIVKPTGIAGVKMIAQQLVALAKSSV
jgi:CheY-like chemotaxis protein